MKSQLASFFAVVLFLASTSMVQAVDLTGNRLRVEGKHTIMWDNPSEGTGFAMIYFAPSGDRYVFLDVTDGVRLGPGQTHDEVDFGDHRYGIDLVVTGKKLTLTVRYADSLATLTRHFEASLNSSTSCRTTKYTYDLSNSDARIVYGAKGCKIFPGPPN